MALRAGDLTTARGGTTSIVTVTEFNQAKNQVIEILRLARREVTHAHLRNELLALSNQKYNLDHVSTSLGPTEPPRTLLETLNEEPAIHVRPNGFRYRTDFPEVTDRSSLVDMLRDRYRKCIIATYERAVAMAASGVSESTQGAAAAAPTGLTQLYAHTGGAHRRERITAKVDLPSASVSRAGLALSYPDCESDIDDLLIGGFVVQFVGTKSTDSQIAAARPLYAASEDRLREVKMGAVTRSYAKPDVHSAVIGAWVGTANTVSEAEKDPAKLAQLIDEYKVPPIPAVGGAEEEQSAVRARRYRSVLQPAQNNYIYAKTGELIDFLKPISAASAQKILKDRAARVKK